MKRCSKCGIEKELQEFYITRRSKDGLKPWCKSCIKEYNQDYLKKYSEKNLERCRLRYFKNRDKELIRMKKRLNEHREENKKKCTEYRQKNNERLREYDRIRYYENLEKSLQKRRQYQKSPKGRIAFARSRDKRKRGFKFNVIFPCELDEPFVFHHFNHNNDDVVGIPEDIHKLFLCGTNSKKHREMLLPIVEQLYPDIKLVLGEKKE